MKKINVVENPLLGAPEWLIATWEKKNLPREKTFIGMKAESEKSKKHMQRTESVAGFGMLVIACFTIMAMLIFFFRIHDSRSAVYGVAGMLLVAICGSILSVALKVWAGLSDDDDQLVINQYNEAIALFMKDLCILRQHITQAIITEESLRELLISLSGELIFAEESLTRIRLDMTFGVDALTGAVDCQQRAKANFEQVWSTARNKFGLFAEMMKRELFFLAVSRFKDGEKKNEHQDTAMAVIAKLSSSI